MKMLEKWYVWGGGKTPVNVHSLIFNDGEVLRLCGAFNTIDYWMQGIDLPEGETDVVAYTLGEKVESKRGVKNDTNL